MSPATIESLVSEVYDAYNAREFDRAVGLFADELELRNVATGEVLHGRNGYLQFARGWAAAFPDSNMEVRRLHGPGPQATAQLTIRGTHTGTLIGVHGHVPPTWAQVELEVCELFRFENELITGLDSYYDTGTLLRQMGLFPNSPLHAPDRRASLDLYALETDSSTQQRNKVLVQRFVQRVMNRRDAESAGDFHIANIALHGGPMGETRDLDGYRARLEDLFMAFPDLEMELLDCVAEADRVAVRATLTGTHRGEFRGIAATGKRISGTGASTFRVVDARIVEEWWHHDLFGILQQIDAIPAALSTSLAGR
jgi:steroid delta-isomerase-like uncharacterized protein